MKKDELVKKVSQKTGVSEEETKSIINSIIDSLFKKNSLKESLKENNCNSSN